MDQGGVHRIMKLYVCHVSKANSSSGFVLCDSEHHQSFPDIRLLPMHLACMISTTHSVQLYSCIVRLCFGNNTYAYN